MKELLREMSRLVLRQSDSLNYLQLDVGFMLFLRTTMKPTVADDPTAAMDWTIVPDLYKAATQWHKDKTDKPENIVTTLMYCVITTLLERVESTINKPQDQERLRKLGILEENTFLFLR